MTELTPATSLAVGDTITLILVVRDVKPSDHKHYGLHDLITADLMEDAGDLPNGLRVQIRRPHDGTADLRSGERKAKDAPVVDETMKKDELLAVAKERGVEVSDRATKKEIVAALGA